MNITICSAAIVILLSSAFMMFLKDNNLFLKFMNTLNSDQKEIYNKIIKERLSLYFGGMLLGIFIGLLYLFYSKKSNRNICIFIVIVFITKMIVYKGYPKSTYMLYNLSCIFSLSNCFSDKFLVSFLFIFSGFLGKLFFSCGFIISYTLFIFDCV